MFRPMRRHAQQLDRSTCEEILRSAPRGVLSVAGDDGYPYGVPLDHVYDDGKIYFHCATSGHKLDAIEKCDKACFTVLDEGRRNEGEWWLCFSSVIAFGRVRRLKEIEEIIEKLRLIGAKYFPEGYDTEGEITKSLPRVAVLEFAIEHLSGKFVREK